MRLTESEISLIGELPFRQKRHKAEFWGAVVLAAVYTLLRLSGLFPHFDMPFDSLVACVVVIAFLRRFRLTRTEDRYANLLQRIASSDAEIIEQLASNKTADAS